MYDNIRKAVGCIMIFITVLLLAAGLFPLNKPNGVKMQAYSLNEESLSDVPHLDASDLFNTGSTGQLLSLPGIGEATAALIIEEVGNNGTFVYPEDILSVKGIGLKKLEQLRPFLKITSGESED